MSAGLQRKKRGLCRGICCTGWKGSITLTSNWAACIANIYYFDDDVHKKYAPYFGFEELKDDYDRLSWNIPDYNFWDFAVTMNKMYADHIDVVGKWSKNKDTTRKRISELAISFLCDESTNHPTDKIWWYMNS